MTGQCVDRYKYLLGSKRIHLRIFALAIRYGASRTCTSFPYQAQPKVCDSQILQVKVRLIVDVCSGNPYLCVCVSCAISLLSYLSGKSRLHAFSDVRLHSNQFLPEQTECSTGGFRLLQRHSYSTGL